ncbi:MAG: hypothetical protein ABL921_12360 [Pirellula sp.]
MNFSPENNPYTPAAFSEPGDGSNEAQPLQGFSKLACVLFIILGALGLMVTLQSVFGFAYAMFGPADARIMMSPFPGAIFISMSLVFVKFIASVGDIVGGIQGLQQRRFGATLIRWIAAVMMVIKALETCFQCAFTYLGMDAIIEHSMKDIPNQSTPPPFDMGEFMHVIFYITIGVTIAMGLAMFLFYLFTFLHFSKAKTLAQFYKR